MEALCDERIEEVQRLETNLETAHHNTEERGKHLNAILEYERKNGNDALARELANVKAEQLANMRTAAAEKSGLLNHGATYDDVGTRQRLRKVEVLRSRAEKAFCFVESFGLMISGLTLESPDGHHIDLVKNQRKKTTFQDLDDKEKGKIDSVLFLLDRFCASDDLYNEFVQVRQRKFS